MREPIVSIVKCESNDWDKSVPPAVREAVDRIGAWRALSLRVIRCC
ncbi:MAG: hypothetical protein ACOC7U_10125 [Spirochaetota bacterium]